MQGMAGAPLGSSFASHFIPACGTYHQFETWPNISRYMAVDKQVQAPDTACLFSSPTFEYAAQSVTHALCAV